MALSSNFFARLDPVYYRLYLTFLSSLVSWKLFLTSFFFCRLVPFLTPKYCIHNLFLAILLIYNQSFLTNLLFTISLCLRYRVLFFVPHISSQVLKAASFFIKERSKTISSWQDHQEVEYT
jgi:hypothetical protein